MHRDPEALATRLADLDAHALRRSRRVVEAFPEPGDGTRAIVAGQAVRVFCSNDYLGLAQHPALAAAQRAASDRFGTGSGAAHLISGHSSEHHALEEELAAYTGRERALLFSTGYMANLGALGALAERGEVVLQDRLNHASLLDGARICGARLLRYAHADAADAARRLAEEPRCSVVASDGLFSMDGDVAPVRALAVAAARQRAWLLIDDAHGLGVLGASGRGTLEAAQLGAGDVPVLVGTLGKAFGSSGAFVAGDAGLIELLLQRARTYVYTTALPPGSAAASRAALALAQREPWRRERLQALIARLRAGAAALDLPLLPSASPIQPLLAGSARRALRWAAALYARGFWVSAIRPPTVPEGRARLRITLSAAHGEADVDALLEATRDAWRECAATP